MSTPTVTTPNPCSKTRNRNSLFDGWLNHTPEKYAQVKFDHSARVLGVKINKSLKPSPTVDGSEIR